MPEERKHALLSASAAKRWIHCPPSAKLCDSIEEKESDFAKEGTLAHEICELKLRKTFLEPMGDRTYKTRFNKLKKNDLYNPEMDKYTEEYLDYIKEVVYRYNKPPHISVEKRVEYGHVAQDGFGTSDCIILCGTDCHVIDFKYGKGIPVSAEGNPQLAIYAIGAIAAYGMFYPIEDVYLHVVQPRKSNFSSWKTTAQELAIWAEKVVKPAAELAFEGKGEYKQGTWCDDCFCNVGGCCRARADENMALEKEYTNPITGELITPPLLTNEEVGEILARAQHVARWVKKLEQYALGQMLGGQTVPGWKLVEGRSNRAFKDIDAAYKELQQAGYNKAMLYTQVPISLTEVTTLVSKEDYTGILEKHIVKPKGAPTLATAEDKRQEYVKETAADAFGGENQYQEEK